MPAQGKTKLLARTRSFRCCPGFVLWPGGRVVIPRAHEQTCGQAGIWPDHSVVSGWALLGSGFLLQELRAQAGTSTELGGPTVS